MVALDSFYPMTGVTTQLAQWQKFSPLYFGDGVINGGLNNFSVGQHGPPGMSVDVATGRCFIQGVFGENGSIKNLAIAAADATNPRKDRVVLRCDTVAQDLEVLVLTGVAAVSPSPPALIRSATQTDYSLCQVLVGTTVTSIVTANITDERQYASPRGLAHGPDVVAATTIEPYGPNPLTEGVQWTLVTGTTTVTNVAVANAAPRGGAILVLEFLNAGCTVSRVGNIVMSRNYISGAVDALLTLLWDGTQWIELARANEQAPAHQYYGNPTGTVAAATFAAIVAADLPSYAGVTMGSLTQGVGVAYTPTGVRAAQFGKTYHVHGQIAPTGTGTAGSLANLQLPSGVSVNMNAAEPLGTWRIDGANTLVGVLSVGAGGTSMNFHVPTNPASFWGVTPNVSLNNSTTLWFNVTAELV